MPMDNLIDVFSGDAFSVLTLSTALQMVPNQYGRLNAMGLFRDVGIPTLAAAIEVQDGVLNLIPSSPRGTAAPKNKRGDRKLKYFEVPHIALDDVIKPSDIQNVRAFGSLSLQTPETVVNDKLISMGYKHDVTSEYLKCGCIAGKIYDADGTTVLLDLFTEFGVTEEEIFFDLDNANADVVGAAQTVNGTMEDNLLGETMSHVHALCSPGFWSKFIKHKAVRDDYKYWNVNQSALMGLAGPGGNPIRDDVRKGFVWQGILWEEYRGKAPYLSGSATEYRNFIEPGMCRFIPIGTRESFINYYAPGEFMEAVNTAGIPRYAFVEPHRKQVDIFTESNPLPICLRPKLLIKGNSAAA